MSLNYAHRITFFSSNAFNIQKINNLCQMYPNENILVEIPNTKGITPQMIRLLKPNVMIRIVGGFTHDRVRNGEQQGNGYEDSVVYTRNETIKIIEAMEKIEDNINPKWSPIQKVIYIYDCLKRKIMYDPQFESKSSKDVRSLRGLISKQTVCIGYALIFKEFMDRLGIECEYVEGNTKPDKKGGFHGWNIIVIDGKKYPIDLTWDNTAFRSGESKSFQWLGCDIEKFCNSHYPSKMEKTQDYHHTLTAIDPKVIKKIHLESRMGTIREYQSTTFQAERGDGSKFLVAQIDDAVLNHQKYYRYYYMEEDNNGKRKMPLILYSKTNIVNLVNCRRFHKPVPPHYESTVINVLFSKENIKDSLDKRTFYIGCATKQGNGNTHSLVTSYQEIEKPEKERSLFAFPTRRFVRSDGSVMIIQQMLDKVKSVKGADVMRYDILEVVREKGEDVLKRNVVYTERNLFTDNRKEFVDQFLSRSRIDQRAKNAGGYIGYYDANGNIVDNPDLIDYFSPSKTVTISMTSKKKTSTIPLPSFEELKDLASNYEVYYDSLGYFDPDPATMKIRNIHTKKTETDPNIIDKAILANIWLAAAGIKYHGDDIRPGWNYAFNEKAKELYEVICEEMMKDCQKNGVIDTVGLFHRSDSLISYKYTDEILVNFFKTPFQTELINRLCLQAVGREEQSLYTPEPLYTLSYAGSLDPTGQNKR